MYSFWGKNSRLYKIASNITFLGREKKLRSGAVNKLELKKGDAVLDLCCGTGLNFPYLLEAVGGKGKVIGFDSSPEMLAAAKKTTELNGWTNVKLAEGDATTPDLPKGSFDGVLSTLGISTIPQHVKAIKATRDILKPGKKMIVLDAKPFSGFWKVLNPLIKLVYKKSANWDYQKNVVKSFAQFFPQYKIEEYNAGTIYILNGTKI